MTSSRQGLMVTSLRTDEELRQALKAFEGVLTARIHNVGAEVGEIAASVVSRTLDEAVRGVQRELYRHAWAAIGISVGIGWMLGRASRR